MLFHLHKPDLSFSPPLFLRLNTAVPLISRKYTPVLPASVCERDLELIVFQKLVKLNVMDDVRQQRELTFLYSSSKNICMEKCARECDGTMQARKKK